MDIVIVGAGGHGKVVLEAIRAAGEHRVVGFVDANPALAGSTVMGVTVLGPIAGLARLRGRGVGGAVVAIGDNRVRRACADEVDAAGLDLVSAAHPAATVSPSASVGRGVLLAAGSVVAAEATVGDGAVVNTASVVEHECAIGDFAHVAPGAVLGGRVTVGSGAMVGLGSRVLPCLTVGDGATVGAGAVVIADVLPGVTVVGVPARPIRG